MTDSTAYLPSELIGERGIDVVSLYVSWDDRSERESEMPNLDAFYERLRGAQRLPTTSQPSIGDFLEVYEPLVEAGQDIVSIHLSGGISGTVEAARQAAERITKRWGTGRVTVIDSTSMCGGLALVVLVAARAAAGNGDAEEVARCVRDARQEMKMWFALDTLEYVRRGGRIGAASAWLGSALKVKPILTPRGAGRPGRARPHPRKGTPAPCPLRAAAQERRLRSVARTAHPGTRQRQAAGRGRTGGHGLPSAVRVRGRPGRRVLRRPGHVGHRSDARQVPRVASGDPED